MLRGLTFKKINDIIAGARRASIQLMPNLISGDKSRQSDTVKNDIDQLAMDLNEIQSLSSSNLETSKSDSEDENENNAKQDELKNKTNNNLDRGFIESSHKSKTNNTRSSVSLKQLIDLKEEIVEPKCQDIFAEKESTIRHEDESAAASNMSISKLLPPIVNHFNNSK